MYYIYHIEGVKIGCSKNPKVRVKQQGYSVFQVLEVHQNIEVASKREIELQIQYGYGRDSNVPYHKSSTFGTFEGRSKAGKKNITTGHISNLGKIQGKNNVESGQLASIRTIKGSIKGGKIGGKIQGKNNVESGHISNLGKIYGSINGKIAAAIERTCPYCSKTMKGGVYFRHHGPRCKLVPVTT